MKWVKEQIQKHNEAEQAEFTFKPNLKASSSSRALSSARGSSAQGRSSIAEPNGFEKVVNRMKKHQKEKEQMELKQFKSSIGERYNKEKLNKVKPPSFMSGSNDQGQQEKGKELILCIEVAISPTQ
jgi:hypothetical protein